MANHGERGHVPLWLVVAFVVLLIALALCLALRRGPYAAQATAPPTFRTRVDSTPQTTLLSYARGLHYDTLLGAADSERVMRGTCPGRCTYGPLVKIEPESGSASLSATQLGQGRIVARLIRYVGPDTMPYPKFALAPGDTVYWWVDSVQTGRWRSVFIPSRRGAVAQSDTSLVVDRHPGYHWWQGLARFVWKDSDPALWVTCTETGCCKTSGI